MNVKRAKVIADAFVKDAVVKVATTNTNGAVRFNITGTFDGANYTNIKVEGEALNTSTMEKDGDNLIVKLQTETYGYSIYTFNAVTNSYTYEDHTTAARSPRVFNGVTIDGESVSLN